MFSLSQQHLLNELIRGDEPFLLCAFPEQRHFTLYTKRKIDDCAFAVVSDADVEIVDFDGRTHTFDDEAGSEPSLETKSTSFEEYKDAFSAVVASLRRNGGKTVLSRVVCGNAQRTFADIAADYFSEFGNTFRYIYNMPSTGLWIGASPELLLDNDMNSGELHTAALAGTRTCNEASMEWDRKNLEEHELVVRFITDCLVAHGLTPVAGTQRSKRFGEIEHLMTPISSKSTEKAAELLHTLSPTPALSGYPRHDSLLMIKEVERHNRRCYGGYISVTENCRTRAYVNLRCARLSRDRSKPSYNVFVGGGVTALSELHSEWNETERKSDVLLAILNNQNK